VVLVTCDTLRHVARPKPQRITGVETRTDVFIHADEKLVVKVEVPGVTKIRTAQSRITSSFAFTARPLPSATMHRRYLALALSCGWLALGCFSFGQFYAPDTEYHDLAQRCFVPEAARVLAARENHLQTNITHETIVVSNSANRETTWQVRWLGDKNKVLREATVTYPESLLSEGPKFYRTVFQQLWKVGWRSPARATAAKQVPEFWRGANQAGLSRMESLQQAWKFEASKPSEENVAPHLAGLLQSATLPVTGGALSLDALLLARGAAWLCLAEQAGGSADAFEFCWAPTLWLAGRENAAAVLWKSQRQGPRQAVGGAMFEGWDFLLRQPRAKEAFVYAVTKEHRSFTMPLIAYYARVAQIGGDAGQMMWSIFATDQTSLFRLHDYGPFLSSECGVAGGRVLEGSWPALSRLAWLKAMEDQPISSLDYTGHVKLVKKTLLNVTEALKHRAPEDTSDPSLMGLKVARPMLNEAYLQGDGKLAPTTVVTARDVLNYGWESSCAQMTARYWFVRNKWGFADLAQSIYTNTIEEVRGSSASFGAVTGRTTKKEVTERMQRLQFCDTTATALRNPPNPLWGADANQARLLYIRRCWLRPLLISEQIYGLTRTRQTEEILPILTRLRAEGGPGGDALALSTLMNMASSTIQATPGLLKLQQNFAAGLLEPNYDQLRVIWRDQYANTSRFERAQIMEKLFWDAPGTHIEEWIYYDYIASHAFTSARRFYDQLTRAMQNPIFYAGGLGSMRHFEALLDNDRPAMLSALADCESGSYDHMHMLIRDAIHQEDDKGLERMINEMRLRYPTSDPKLLENMRGFLPLLPALRATNHVDRARALDYFANKSGWAVLQWILIQKYRLSTEEAVRFLGGDDTDVTRRGLICYLRKDKAGFTKILEQAQQANFSGVTAFLFYRLQKDLFQITEPEGQKDLRPASAQSIEQAVRAILPPPPSPPQR
jgi:hypothetical protein